jgi:hypothetical protein
MDNEKPEESRKRVIQEQIAAMKANPAYGEPQEGQPKTPLWIATQFLVECANEGVSKAVAYGMTRVDPQSMEKFRETIWPPIFEHIPANVKRADRGIKEIRGEPSAPVIMAIIIAARLLSEGMNPIKATEIAGLAVNSTSRWGIYKPKAPEPSRSGHMPLSIRGRGGPGEP